jgi:hypothetical protein
LILPGKLVFNNPYYKWIHYMNTKAAYKIKVADEVWVAMALLHREYPSRTDFTLNEIVERAANEGIMDELRPGVYVHAALHCVANRPPNPGRYRMLYETRPKYRRLFRLGDSYDPQREGSKVTPNADEIPLRYADLLEWYESWCRSHGERAGELDPLLGTRTSSFTFSKIMVVKARVPAVCVSGC